MNTDEVLAYLKRHSSEIGKAARDGDPLAITTVQAYNMYYNCPDTGAIAMLQCAVEEWLNKSEKRGK